MLDWRLRPILALALLVLTALGGCGNGDSGNDRLLSSSSAAALRSTLSQVQQTVEQGDCNGAEAEVSTLQQQVTSLDGVRQKLKDALAAGARRLKTLVVQKCRAPLAATGPTGPAQPEQGTTDEQGNQDEQDGKGKGKEKKPKKHEQPQDEGGGSQGDQTGGSVGTTGSEQTIP
jgi:hypothetical protein